MTLCINSTMYISACVWGLPTAFSAFVSASLPLNCLFVYFHVSSVFACFPHTSLFSHSLFFKVRLNMNHYIVLFLRIIKFFLLPESSSFSCRHFSWTLKFQCPWEKKKKVLDYFPNPDEFPRNVHQVTPTFIYRKYWCPSMFKARKKKSVKGDSRLSGA